MPKKMKIKANSISPDNQGVALYEPVELTAEEDCVVLLGLGLGVKLKKNETCLLAVTTDGHHPFQVVYLRDLCEPEPLIMEERIGVAEAGGEVGVAVMSGTTTLLKPALLAGPTGDIHVP